MSTCAHCGTAMPTPTGRASRKRFCSVDCRKAAWRERHRHDDDVHRDVVSLAVPAGAAVLTAFPDDVPTPGGQHRCPHCRKPLAVISVVIPADAAHIKPPEVLPPTPQTANLEPPPGEDDLATLGNFGERQHPNATASEPRRALAAPNPGLPVLERARYICAVHRRANQPVTGTVLARQLGVSDGYARRLLRQLATNAGDAA